MNAPAADTATAPVQNFEDGSWQATLAQSTALKERAGKANKKAGALLWSGAQDAIEEWLPEADSDVSGESLYNDLLDALGVSRKGDASKIKSVALAVKNNGLVLSVHPNLFKAYNEAVRLTKTVQQQAAEDTAADEAVSNIDAPKSSSSPEGAAKIVLSKGVDEAAKLLLDALNLGGPDNPAAHRAFLRAISQEIAGRVPKPAPKPKSTKPKGAATKAKGASPKAAVKTAGTKAKPKGAPTGAAKKATAVKAEPKAKPEQAEPVDEATANAVSTPDVPVKRAAVKGKPVVVRRG